jgi:hypothetical protein
MEQSGWLDAQNTPRARRTGGWGVPLSKLPGSLWPNTLQQYIGTGQIQTSWKSKTINISTHRRPQRLSHDAMTSSNAV